MQKTIKNNQYQNIYIIRLSKYSYLLKKWQYLFLYYIIININLCAGTIYVNSRMSLARDTNPGTEARPLKTITAALKRAKPGNTILVQPGIYQETIEIHKSQGMTKEKPLIIKSAKPHEAVILGSREYKADCWRRENPLVWSCKIKNVVEAGPTRRIELNGVRIPGNQVYINGSPYEWNDLLRGLSPGQWHLNAKKARIYVAFPAGKSPQNTKVQISEILAGLRIINGSHITIDGFKFLHGANTYGYKGNLVTGNNITINNCQFLWTANVGFTAGRLSDSTVTNNLFAWNGMIGVNFGQRVHSTKFTGNKILYNNWRLCNTNYTACGMKMCVSFDNVISNNISAHNVGAGIWSDISGNNVIINNNIVHDNLGRGIFIETDWDQTVTNNIVFRTWKLARGEASGIMIAESTNCKISNNVIFGCEKAGIRLRFPLRSTRGHRKFHKQYELMKKILPTERYNKLISDNKKYVLSTEYHYGGNNNFTHNVIFDNVKAQYTEQVKYPLNKQMGKLCKNKSDNNIFFTSDMKNLFSWCWGIPYKGLTDWQKRSGRDINSKIIHPVRNYNRLPDWGKKLMDKAKPYLSKQSAKSVRKFIKELPDSPNATILLSRAATSNSLRKFPIKNTHVSSVIMRLKDKHVMALWSHSVGNNYYVRLKTNQKKVIVENPWEQKRELKTKNGIIDLLVTYKPLYIHGLPSNVEVVEVAELTFSKAKKVDKSIDAILAVTNHDSKELKYNAEVVLPKGLKTTNVRLKATISPGEVKKFTIPISSVDGEQLAGKHQIVVRGKLGTVAVDALNYLIFQKNSSSLRKIERIHITSKLSYWNKLAIDKYFITGINNINAIKSGDKNQWTGENDQSAKVWAAWDEFSLYIAVEVKDDKIIPNENAIYNADSVEFFLDGRLEVMQFERALTQGCVHLLVAPNGKRKLNVGRGDIRSAALTEKGKYRVMIQINANQVFGTQRWGDNRLIRLGILINDRDVAGTKISNVIKMVWGGTANNYQDSTGWRPLILKE